MVAAFRSPAATPVIRGNIIVGNTGNTGGGISLFNQSDAVITGNLIARNTAAPNGLGIWVGAGGGIFWLVPSGARGPTLANNTIVDNISSQGRRSSSRGSMPRRS